MVRVNLLSGECDLRLNLTPREQARVMLPSMSQGLGSASRSGSVPLVCMSFHPSDLHLAHGTGVRDSGIAQSELLEPSWALLSVLLQQYSTTSLKWVLWVSGDYTYGQKVFSR